MKELTDSIIKDLFSKTGVDEKYFPYYESDLKMRFKEFRNEFPYDENEDEEERAEDEKLEKACIDNSNEYIKYYVKEAEKGHCPKWCACVAMDVSGTEGYEIYRKAYDGLESAEEKERELDIHTNSLSDDPLFRERYKELFKEPIEDPLRDAEQYVKVYRNLISKGKSDIYARAYAEAVNFDYQECFCDIYARAYELAINHGMNSSDAYCFGEYCTNACDCGIVLEVNDFVKNYKEIWQKEFCIELICDDIRRNEEKEIDTTLLNSFKKKMGLQLE